MDNSKPLPGAPVDNFAPLQGPYEESRSAFHTLIVNRIYHEDMLFAQRSYVLLGVHAFLMTAFTVLVAGRDSRLASAVGIPLTVVGSLMGIFQASFGRQTGRAIGFWREYLRLIEAKWQIAFDHLQYDFYLKARAETPFGVIGKKAERQRPLYKILPRLGFLTSITKVVGELFPTGLALAWALNLLFVLRHHFQRYWVGIVGF